MPYARPIMWNVPHWAEITLYLLIPLVILAFAAGVVWRVRRWSLGQAEPGTETVRQRLAQILDLRRLAEWAKAALFQWRLTNSDPFALIMHQAIFWGMVILAVGTALATVDQDFTNLIFDFQVLRGGFYKLFKLAMDVFGIALIAGVTMAACRRYLVRPKRLALTKTGISRWDAFPFLSVLALIAVTGFVTEGLRLAEGLHLDSLVRTAAAQSVEAKGKLLEELGMSVGQHMGPQRRVAELRRIADGGHVFPAALVARRLHPGGTLEPALLRDDSASASRDMVGSRLSGVRVDDLDSLHQGIPPDLLADQHVFPPGRARGPVASSGGVGCAHDPRPHLAASHAGRGLHVVRQMSGRMPRSQHRLSPFASRPRPDGGLTATARRVQGEWRRADPPRLAHSAGRALGLLHLPRLRRGLPRLCPAAAADYRHAPASGGPGKSRRGSPRCPDEFPAIRQLVRPIGPKAGRLDEAARFQAQRRAKDPVEYLWFVGDYASYDQRAQEVTRTIAKVLHRAGEDVGLLYEKEQNAGNDVRRTGEEGLFSMLREKNGKELANAKFSKVLTTDPHTYNTLKNEYEDGVDKGSGGTPRSEPPAKVDDGGPLAGKAVLHYTELLDDLIRRGKLPLARSVHCTVTYHDPCYLGRYNGVYEAPRRVLRALGAEVVEMPRNRARSFCCGAGGGRIWMKDSPGIEERPAENRVKEALSLPGVECLVVACPKDLAMFQDAVKTVGAEGRLRVADLGELVYEAMDVA